MQPAQIIVLATPVFLALIALEWWVGVRRGHDTYRLNDALASIGLGMLSQLAGLFPKALTLGVYVAVHAQWAVFDLPADSVAVWAGALLLYDFLYYWHHRAGHRVALLWAAHAVHHQSEDYNLSTALRQTGSGWLAGWVFYLPMALLGVPPVVFAGVALIDLLYQFWVHTRQVGRLGAFDRWFCSPSNHRVHHAVNDAYLDRNYGGILMVWDRWFGTFADERDDEAVVYGTRTPLRSFDPVRANLQGYAAMAVDAWHTRRWADKLRVVLMPPGWRPADRLAADPKPPFSLDAARRRHDPPASRAAQGLAVALFVAALGGTAVLLWTAHEQPVWQLAAGSLVVLAALQAVGALLGRSGSLPADPPATAARSAR